jgi:hypothetical protein
MSDIITVDYLKKVPLPIKETQWDKIDEDFLEEIVGAAGDFLEDYLDRKIALTTYAERIVGTDRPVLILQHYPLVSLVSVTELDEIEGALMHDLSGFVLHNAAGMIEWRDKWRNGFWSTRNYRVEYQAGYEVIPPTLKLATALQAYEMIQPFLRGSRDMQQVDLVPMSSEKFVELTEPYRRKRIA